MRKANGVKKRKLLLFKGGGGNCTGATDKYRKCKILLMEQMRRCWAAGPFNYLTGELGVFYINGRKMNLAIFSPKGFPASGNGAPQGNRLGVGIPACRWGRASSLPAPRNCPVISNELPQGPLEETTCLKIIIRRIYQAQPESKEKNPPVPAADWEMGAEQQCLPAAMGVTGAAGRAEAGRMKR